MLRFAHFVEKGGNRTFAASERATNLIFESRHSKPKGKFCRAAVVVVQYTFIFSYRTYRVSLPSLRLGSCHQGRRRRRMPAYADGCLSARPRFSEAYQYQVLR